MEGGEEGPCAGRLPGEVGAQQARGAGGLQPGQGPRHRAGRGGTQHARGEHDGGEGLALRVERAAERQPDRSGWTEREGGPGQLPEEARVRGGAGEHGAERRDVEAPGRRPRVEEDGGLERRLGRGLGEPCLGARAELVEAEAPAAGVEAARADRQPLGGELGLDPAGQSSRPRLLAGSAGVGQDQRVVLVGAGRRLTAPLGAERQPGPGGGRGAAGSLVLAGEAPDAGVEPGRRGRVQSGESLDGRARLRDQLRGESAGEAERPPRGRPSR